MSPAPAPLDNEQISELLKLLKDADTTELKMTVPEAGYRSAASALGMDPLDAQIRQVFFFDTPDLLLNRNGLVVRARRSAGGVDDSVVKLRPVVPSELPAELREVPEFGVEVDALPGGYVCSASYKAKLDSTTHVRQVMEGTRPVRKLFTKGQQDFFAAHAPDGITLEELSLLGPINVLKLKFHPEELRQRMVAEMWLYPDGARILELSTKCLPSEAFQVAVETRAYLTDHGVDLTGEQQTKTATALAFFSKEMQAATSA